VVTLQTASPNVHSNPLPNHGGDTINMIEIEEDWGAAKMIVLSNLDSLEEAVASLSISKKPEFMIMTPHQAFALGPKKGLTEKEFVIMAPHQAFISVPKEGLAKEEFEIETATAHGMTRSGRCYTPEELAQGGHKRDH